MAIQRNARVAPFSVNSPLTKKDSKGRSTGILEDTHQKWFTQAGNAINATVELSGQVPATSSSPGEPGTLVPFSGGFYFCVGSNTWLKFTGAPF